jgi:hypothetical protein
VIRLIKVTALVAGLIASAGIFDAHEGRYPYGSYVVSGSNAQFSDASFGIAREYGGMPWHQLENNRFFRPTH